MFSIHSAHTASSVIQPARARAIGSTKVARPSSIQCCADGTLGKARCTISCVMLQLRSKSAADASLPTLIVMRGGEPGNACRRECRRRPRAPRS
jgi:hypothetical protein